MNKTFAISKSLTVIFHIVMDRKKYLLGLLYRLATPLTEIEVQVKYNSLNIIEFALVISGAIGNILTGLNFGEANNLLSSFFCINWDGITQNVKVMYLICCIERVIINNK